MHASHAVLALCHRLTTLQCHCHRYHPPTQERPTTPLQRSVYCPYDRLGQCRSVVNVYEHRLIRPGLDLSHFFCVYAVASVLCEQRRKWKERAMGCCECGPVSMARTGVARRCYESIQRTYTVNTIRSHHHRSHSVAL